ncbi:MAG: winged helix-turn-helix transcriptional regulator [Candidatus Thermoplasmatota archaeon]|nr:winged helix-turn-helix transcriptional regulator [Candidatus Thermoplasmatota archaeon]
MDRRSTYMAIIVATLALAMLGAVSTAFLAFYSPSSSEGALDLRGADDGMEKDLGGEPAPAMDDNPNGTDRTSEGEVAYENPPSQNDSYNEDPFHLKIIPYIAVATLVACLLFIGVTGRAYMESSRHENMVRNDLMDLISVNPGINLTGIRNELQLSQGAVSYHLRRLEKRGNIYSHKGLKERRYYPAGMGYKRVEDQSAQDEVRSVISNPTAGRILALLETGPAAQSDVVNEVGISASTVHWHMDRLEKLGLVEKRKDGRNVTYVLKMGSEDT